MAFLKFLIRRLSRHWQLFLTVSVGVLLATALLASGPLFVDAAVEFGLRRILGGLKPDPLEVNLRLQGHIPPETTEVEAQQVRAGGLIAELLGPFVAEVVPYQSTYWAFPWFEGMLLTDQRVNFRHYAGARERSELVAGSWPSEPLPEPQVVAAVVSEEFSEAYLLEVGDRLPLSYQREGTQPDLWLEVAGVVRPRDPLDPYWFGALGPLQPEITSRWTGRYNALLLEEDLLTVAQALFPRSELEVGWHIVLNRDAVSAENASALRASIGEVSGRLIGVQPRLVLQTELDEGLAEYEARASSVRVPLYILVAEVVMLALYYVVMVASLSVGNVEGEFATLTSRGASAKQLFELQALEAGLLALVALVSGPLLGSLIVRSLVWVGPLKEVPSELWAISITRGAWLAAGVGSLACTLGLLLPVGPALKRTVVTRHQQQRLERSPWWQRTYLDVFFLLLGMVLLWRLRLYDGLLAGAVSSGGVDWLLLLAPVVLLVGTATILLRVFPLLLRFLAFLTSRSKGLSGSLALLHAARNPTHVARLVLLLTLAMALGVLSSGLNATLDLSEAERSRYLAGTDVRLKSDRFLAPKVMAELPGIRDATVTLRRMGSTSVPGVGAFHMVDVLGVVPAEVESFVEFRDDFADESVGELLGRLGNEIPDFLPTVSLPGRPAELGVWLNEPPSAVKIIGDGEGLLEHLHLQAKLMTAPGEVFFVELEPGEIQVDESGRWRHYSAEIDPVAPELYPLHLLAISLANPEEFSYIEDFVPGIHWFDLVMDEITVVDRATGDRLPAEPFDETSNVWRARGGTAFYQSGGGRYPSSPASLRMRVQTVRRPIKVEIASGYALRSLPAIVSSELLENSDFEVGDELEISVGSLSGLNFEITGIADYFPTLYVDGKTPFVITNRNMLIAYLNYLGDHPIHLNEVWLKTQAGVTGEDLARRVPSVSGIWEREAIRRTMGADPMAVGLRGVTFFGYALTSFLSLVGFGTHFVLSARRRATSYGVLRAMGASAGQIYNSLIVEQLVLIVFGLGFGTCLGVLLNRLVLPGLPLTLGAQAAVPPFYPLEDWWAVGRLYLALSLAFLVILGGATIWLWQARVHRILRIGQE
jgi:hypothetical protein